MKRFVFVLCLLFHVSVKSLVKSLWWVLTSRPAVFLRRRLSYFSVRRALCPDARGVEILSTLTALWWTLLLLGTPRMFQTNPSFNGLAEHGQEREWGVITWVLSLLGLRVLLGASATVRFCAMAANFMLWMLVALNLAHAAPWFRSRFLWFALPVNTGVGVYTALALLSLWAMKNIAPLVMGDLHNTLEKRKQRKGHHDSKR